MTSLKESYERWVRSEQKWLLPLLDTARNLTLFLPGRFSDTELRSEALYTALNLLTVYHDYILDRARAVTCELKCGPQTATIRQLQVLLMFLHYTEVFMEMTTSVLTRSYPAPQRRRLKWLTITAIEALKAAARLAMLANHGGRMLTPPSQDELNLQTVTQRHTHVLAAAVAPEPSSPSSSPAAAGATSELVSMYLSHGRNSLHPHGKFSLPAPPLPPATMSSALSEALYFIRPVLYTALRLRYSDPSYTPFVLSLLTDLLARALAPRWAQLTAEQKTEWGRRMLLWTLYGLRSPVFEEWTQYPLVRLSQTLSKVPLFGMVGRNVVDLVFSLQQHYFYTSAS